LIDFRKPIAWIGLCIAVLTAIVGFNLGDSYIPAREVLAEDSRNSVAKIAVYHRWGVSPRTIVLDLRSVNDDAAAIDIDRMVFQIAERFHDRTYDKVILAFRGEPKFRLDGAYFRRIGSEYAWQNPIVLVRTLPENVEALDGGRAFSEWSGGLLGVVSRQLEDHNSMHQQWYRDDIQNNWVE